MVQDKVIFKGKYVKKMDFEKWRFRHTKCKVTIYTTKDEGVWYRLHYCQKCGECYVEGKGGYIRGSKFNN